MPDFDLTGQLSLKIELHMLRPITEKVHSGNGPVSLVQIGSANIDILADFSTTEGILFCKCHYFQTESTTDMRILSILLNLQSLLKQTSTKPATENTRSWSYSDIADIKGFSMVAWGSSNV